MKTIINVINNIFPPSDHPLSGHDSFEFIVSSNSIENQRDKSLFYDGQRIFLKDEGKEIYFNFDSEWKYHKSKKYSLKKELLARALSIKGDGSTHVIDCTCGTGKDSILLLAFGAKVTAFERNPVVYALLSDALFSVQVEELKSVLNSRFSLQFGTFLDIYNQNPLVFDSLYFDPMFPEKKKKSALSRKEMMAFKEVVGDDPDAGEYFSEVLLAVPSPKRFIVKRHPKSEDLIKGVNARFEGKSARYDLYV